MPSPQQNKTPSFPVEAFGEIAPAVERMAAYCQVAPEMIGSLVLSTTSALVQALVNVSEATFDTGCPSSINILVVAGTGERKSTALNVVGRPMREGIRGGANNRDSMILQDVTVDGLASLLVNVCPSCTVIASEASMLFGGHAMNKENLARFLGIASALFSGEAFSRTRVAGHSSAEERRLNLTLISQPIVAMEFLSSAMVMQQGFGNRFLYCAPPSLVGSRAYADIDLTNDPAYLSYCARIRSMASQEWIIDPITGGVVPRTMRMTPEAKEAWITLHDVLEAEAGPGGQYADHVGYTIRFAEQVKRIAALLALLDDPTAEFISEDVMVRAIELGDYYFDVARQLFTMAPANKDELDARSLLDWMRNKQLSENLRAIPVRLIYKDGPRSARPSKRARELLELLESRGEIAQYDGAIVYGGGDKKRSAQNYEVINP